MPKVNSATGHGWTAFPDWPPPTSGPVRLHFNSDASLAEAPDKRGDVSYQVDPADGSATYWNHGYSEASGPADEQAQDLARVTFTTPPLKKDVVVAGATEVNLRAALSATDGNLVVRMTDVDPSGASIIVASGWLKASHRLGHERLARSPRESCTTSRSTSGRPTGASPPGTPAPERLLGRPAAHRARRARGDGRDRDRRRRDLRRRPGAGGRAGAAGCRPAPAAPSLRRRAQRRPPGWACRRRGRASAGGTSGCVCGRRGACGWPVSRST